MGNDRYPAPRKPTPPPGTRWERLRPILRWALTGFLGFLFLTIGAAKVSGHENVVAQFAAWGYARWFVTVIGVIELGGAAALFVPRLTRGAAYALIAVMAGAAFTHLRAGEWPNPLYNAGFAAALAWLSTFRAAARTPANSATEA